MRSFLSVQMKVVKDVYRVNQTVDGRTEATRCAPSTCHRMFNVRTCTKQKAKGVVTGGS
jgi:hypothetical protein